MREAVKTDEFESLINEYEERVLSEKYISKFKNMPKPSNKWLGVIVQFSGSSNDIYNNGQFYKCKKTQVDNLVQYYWDLYSFGGGDSKPIIVTQAQYDALPQEDKMSGAIYCITDAMNQQTGIINDDGPSDYTAYSSNKSDDRYINKEGDIMKENATLEFPASSKLKLGNCFIQYNSSTKSLNFSFN